MSGYSPQTRKILAGGYWKAAPPRRYEGKRSSGQVLFALFKFGEQNPLVTWQLQKQVDSFHNPKPASKVHWDRSQKWPVSQRGNVRETIMAMEYTSTRRGFLESLSGIGVSTALGVNPLSPDERLMMMHHLYLMTIDWPFGVRLLFPKCRTLPILFQPDCVRTGFDASPGGSLARARRSWDIG